MKTATVNFIYTIYRQIWQPGEAPECSLFDFSQQFDAFCLAFDDDVRARKIIADLADESRQQPHPLGWIWQELQFEIEGHQTGSRREAALSYLECAESPICDYDLDLYNQRMSRGV